MTSDDSELSKSQRAEQEYNEKQFVERIPATVSELGSDPAKKLRVVAHCCVSTATQKSWTPIITQPCTARP